MRFLNFTLIKLCLGYIGGIYLGFLLNLQLKTLVFYGFSLVALMVVFRWLWNQKLLFLWSCILLFGVLGSLTTHVHLPQNKPNHLAHLDLKSQEDVTIQADISEILRSNTYNHKYLLDNLNIDNQAYQGKVLLNVSKDSVKHSLSLGSKIIMLSTLQPFRKARNPQTFDYAKFMQNRDVFAVIYEDKFDLIKGTDFNLSTNAGQWRLNIISALQDAGFKDKHLELIQALILGQKQAINKETYNEFAEVGVVHILAVSGLHVGIVFLILNFLFSPVLRLQYGRLFKVLLTILFLWGFAALAGFSPSVMRAVTMFSFLALGQLFRRKTNSINMLCLSAVVLLIYRPQLLFEVGFQLSYAAVFAIVMLYPVLSKLYQPKYKIPKIFWDTAYVSLAAQIGVLPFQLYYFHQFPGLFLLGNLVIIPFLGVLISGGLFCMVLALLDILIFPFVKTYSFLLDLLVGYVDWLSQFKEFVFQEIFFTKPMFLGILLLVLSFMFMMREYKKSYIVVFSFSLLAFVLVSISEIAEIDKQSEFIIFHKNRQSLIGIKQGRQLQIFSDKTDNLTDTYLLSNYQLINRIDLTEIHTLKNSFKFNNQILTVIDSSGIYLEEVNPDVLILSQSPDIHLEKLIKTIQPKRIVADGNNYKSYVERWRQTAQKYNITFHSTYEEGYFNLP
ncbi:MAG: ComEC family competence protein [Psychroflexus sp.]|nr:ComEC family competence protein [Psychroflexus sp.]